MPYGFQCFGDAGNIQIDENLINYVCVEHGTLTFSGNSDDGTFLTLSYTGEAPMLCLKPTTNFIAQMRTKKVDNTFTWSLLGEDGSVPYYIFDKQPDVTTNIGMTVYNAAGRVVFNSEYHPLRINTIVAVTDEGYPDAVTQHTTSGGTGIYAASVTMPHQSNGANFPVGPSLTQCFKLSGGNVFQTKHLSLVWAPSSNVGRAAGPALIVDVGGI